MRRPATCHRVRRQSGRSSTSSSSQAAAFQNGLDQFQGCTWLSIIMLSSAHKFGCLGRIKLTSDIKLVLKQKTRIKNMFYVRAMQANHICGAVNLVRWGVVGVCPPAYFTIFASAPNRTLPYFLTTVQCHWNSERVGCAGYTLELPYLMQMNTRESLYPRIKCHKRRS